MTPWTDPVAMELLAVSLIATMFVLLGVVLGLAMAAERRAAQDDQ